MNIFILFLAAPLQLYTWQCWSEGLLVCRYTMFDFSRTKDPISFQFDNQVKSAALVGISPILRNSCPFRCLNELSLYPTILHLALCCFCPCHINTIHILDFPIDFEWQIDYRNASQTLTSRRYSAIGTKYWNDWLFLKATFSIPPILSFLTVKTVCIKLSRSRNTTLLIALDEWARLSITWDLLQPMSCQCYSDAQ